MKDPHTTFPENTLSDDEKVYLNYIEEKIGYPLTIESNLEYDGIWITVHIYTPVKKRRLGGIKVLKSEYLPNNDRDSLIYFAEYINTNFRKIYPQIFM